jgi:hypothetical protein
MNIDMMLWIDRINHVIIIINIGDKTRRTYMYRGWSQEEFACVAAQRTRGELFRVYGEENFLHNNLRIV